MTNFVSVAITRIRRSPYQAVAAVSIMTMTLFLAGSFFIIAAGSAAVLRFFETRPEVIGYFRTEISPQLEEVEALKHRLAAIVGVDRVKYTSKEEALKIYTDANASSPLLLEGVTANILPASVEVSGTDPRFLKAIADELRKEPSIGEVQFPEDIVAPLAKWTKSVRVVGMVLVGTHVLITFWIILLIMSVKVANRREEISTFGLLGATPGYISLPFVVEGFIYGLTGGFLAWGIAYLVLLYSMGFWVSFLAGIPILPPPVWFMLSVLVGELALGGVIGGMGGWVAVGRFLRR